MSGSSAGWELALIDSAWHGSPYEGRRGLELARELGYEAIDLFVGFDPGRMTAGERTAYLRDVSESGLPPLSMICTCLGLSDFNPSVRDYHVERACNVIDLGAEFDTVRNLLFVPGDYIFQGRLLPREQEWERVVDATRQVGVRAHQRGLDVAIELLPFEYAFVRTLDDMDRLLDAVGLPNVKAGIDISHLWLGGIEPGELKRFAGRIGQVHVADCDGINHGDLPPGRGNTPFESYLRSLGELGYAGAASVELEFPSDPSQIVAWVAEAHRGTRRLLIDSDLRPDLAPAE
ncbi:MAG TPA: sugar phosphate isomerase/epimerase family protein [Solirubrobacteraceae bacterium]